MKQMTPATAGFERYANLYMVSRRLLRLQRG